CLLVVVRVGELEGSFLVNLLGEHGFVEAGDVVPQSDESATGLRGIFAFGSDGGLRDNHVVQLNTAAGYVLQLGVVVADGIDLRVDVILAYLVNGPLN